MQPLKGYCLVKLIQKSDPNDHFNKSRGIAKVLCIIGLTGLVITVDQWNLDYLMCLFTLQNRSLQAFVTYSKMPFIGPTG